MSNWKPYVIKAKFGPMHLLVSSVSRGYRWRVSTHGTPGTSGDAKRKHGRESIADRVTALLTVPEVDQFVKLADKASPQLWAHPLLPSFEAHVEDLDIPAEIGIYGYFMATFSVVEAFDSASAPGPQPGTLSPAGSQKKANNLYNDFLVDLDGLDDIPADNSGAAFTEAAKSMGDAFEGVDATFDAITDPVGDGTWRDLSRALDSFSIAGDVFVDAAREIESSIGAVAHELQVAPLLIREVVGAAVDSLKAPAGTVASFMTTEPSDLYSMMQDAGVPITEANIAALMEDNLIEDPLFIAAGAIVAIPVYD